MLPEKRHLILGLAVCAILHMASLGTRAIRPAQADVAVTAEDSFQPNGWYAGAPFANAATVRAWGSWSGSDENTGAINIGPFPAPRILRFGLGGYPDNAGNTLYVELAGTAERLPIKHGAIGERWQVVDFELPAAWAGRPIRLVGSDQAKALGGWFAITEPIRGGRGDGTNAMLETFAAWAINGLLLAGIYFAAVRGLLARATLAPQWVPLAAGAVVAACGYTALWAYFANALFGVTVSWILLAAGAYHAFRSHRPIRNREAEQEVSTVVLLLLAIGTFHLALLHLYPSSHDFYTLAANRYREAMPGDNYLPHELADRLLDSRPAKKSTDEWRSSDRPPLQTGWQLLTLPAGKLLNLDRRLATGTSAIWFQLLWVAGTFGLLRTLRVARSRAAGWTAVLAFCGFFVQNTAFTWPKLSSGAFACGAFALLILPVPSSSPRASGWWSATFASLAWLSHGGVAFSFLPLVPWILWRAVRGEWRAWLPGAATILLFVLPWLAYQKFYDPPGNRLFKWHLAGQETIDPRGTIDTIRESYAKAGWRTALANKVTNLQSQFFGDWRSIGEISFEKALDRRTQEFFHPVRAMTWWPGLAVLAIVLTRRRVFCPARDLIVLGGWLAATVVLWCLLMFSPYSAVVHQGSYAAMIGWFVLFTVMLERSGRGWLILIAPLQATTLATTWAVANNSIHGPPVGLPLLIVAAGFPAWLVVRAFRSRETESESIATPSQPSAVERAFAALRDWWRNPRLNFWLLFALAALMLLRKPHALLAPQLWAEDGSVFLNDQDEHGLRAFLLPYMGYLHTLPRLIAWLPAHLLDPAWWPAFYNGSAFAIWLAVLARLFTPRFDLPGKPWLALAFLLVPHSGEVLFNVTNLQWLTAFVLVQQTIIAPPTTRRQQIGDLVILVVVSLTGPFALVFLPLFAWRWWRSRDRASLLALGAVVACAAVQAALIVRTGPKFEFQSAAFQLWPNLVVLARRLVVWPVLGRDPAFALSPAVIGAAGSLFLAGALAWALRPHPRRLLRAQIIAAFGLIVLAGIYRTRPDTWPGDDLDFAERYFYIPRVLLAWLLIWEFDALPWFIARAARLAGLAVGVMNIGSYMVPAPVDYHWAKHCDPIRRGVPANIAILPEKWTLEYRGRPQPR
ncbi:MAG: hypothetical protein EXS37_14245 [Opitutus sp.]|nr:hypothetical protein [Opitutus sp.]